MAAAGRRRTRLRRTHGPLADLGPLVLPHFRSDDMTLPGTRRTVLLATGGAAAALATGCGEYGNKDDSSSEQSSKASAGQELAKTTDIPVGGGKIFAEEKVVVTQPTQGDFKAFSAVCTHQGCVVADIKGEDIDCTCHGSKFSIADGSVITGPATKPLEALKVTVKGDQISVS